MVHRRVSISLSLAVALAWCATAGCKSEKKAAEQPAAPASDVPAAPRTPAPGDETAEPTGERRAPAESYDQALARGQKLARDKKYPDAMRAFEAALAARPDDARALSELSWVAFRANELDRAKQAAEASVAAAEEPKLKAASLYNLGRVAEAQGDWNEAAKAYKESLKLRPHKAVERRLASVESPVRPQRLDGPYADEKSFCAAQRARAPEHARSQFACSLATGALNFEFEAKAPFLGIGMAETDDAAGTLHLAIQTSAGWFVFDEWVYHDEFNMVTVDAVEVAGQRIIIRNSEEASERDSWEDDDGQFYSTLMQVSTTDYVTICGIGASGNVSCVPKVQTGYTSEGQDDYREPSFDVSLGARDKLTVKVSDRNGSDADVSAFVGVHPLAFP